MGIAWLANEPQVAPRELRCRGSTLVDTPTTSTCRSSPEGRLRYANKISMAAFRGKAAIASRKILACFLCKSFLNAQFYRDCVMAVMNNLSAQWYLFWLPAPSLLSKQVGNKRLILSLPASRVGIRDARVLPPVLFGCPPSASLQLRLLPQRCGTKRFSERRHLSF